LLVKQGAATLTLAGANFYGGGTQVNGGTLRVNGSIAGELTVNLGGILQGVGSIGGLVTCASGGTLAPGNSPGALAVRALALDSGAQTQIELGGATRGSQYDAILVGGNATLGGTLNVSLINDFSPALGDSFDLIDWGATSGVFDSVNLPALSAGLAWDASNLYSSGALLIVDDTFLAGDFNHDGTISDSDLAIWMADSASTPARRRCGRRQRQERFSRLAAAVGIELADRRKPRQPFPSPRQWPSSPAACWRVLAPTARISKAA
jgi:autotransporter-associated beta strand protein